MARMSGELALVLVSSSLLTAGYFYYRDNDPAVDTYDAENQASANRSPHSHFHPIFFPMTMRSGYASGGSGGSTNRSSGSISRGGFGSTVAAHTSSGS